MRDIHNESGDEHDDSRDEEEGGEGGVDEAFEEFCDYFQTIDEILHKVPGILVKITLQCSDVSGTFTVREVKFVPNETDVTLTIYYNVMKTSKEHIFTTVRECKMQDNPMDIVLDILWKYGLCPECLHLMPSSSDVCRGCQLHKIRQTYGIEKGYITEHASCMICRESVFHTSLQCGHHIHHTCLLNLHDKVWFTNETNIHCPLCRQSLTEYDKNRYFMV
jgi:hypothetical protein